MVLTKKDYDIDLIQNLVSKKLNLNILPTIERVNEGISTNVYRVITHDQTIYLRIAHEEKENLTPEVMVYEKLKAMEVKAPRVLYYENFNTELERSFMLVTEVRGVALGIKNNPTLARNVLIRVGEDLVKINSISVENFGWIKRDEQEVIKLEGWRKTNQDFLLEDLDSKLLTLVQSTIISDKNAQTVKDVLPKLYQYMHVHQASLAHGDLDPFHIYHLDGVYSGIIDFGDIRGTDPYYDLAFFKSAFPPYFDYILEGYARNITLSNDFDTRITILCLLIDIHFITWQVKNDVQPLESIKNLIRCGQIKPNLEKLLKL